MLYIVTALYCEAKPLIEYYHLDKDLTESRFQVFVNDQIRLVISGQGKIAAAVALSSIFTQVHVESSDYMINIGCCGASSVEMCETGELLLCNKITDAETEFTYYPDMLYQYGIREAEVETVSHVYTGQNSGQRLERNHSLKLYDMEASALYQAASYFIGPHQMVFLKVVSDYGRSEERTDPDDISHLIKKNIKQICHCLGELQEISEVRGQDMEEEADNEEVERLSNQLHCSIVMKNQLRQLITYCRLARIDYTTIINTMTANGQLPCHDKKEGKIRFEQLKGALL